MKRKIVHEMKPKIAQVISKMNSSVPPGFDCWPPEQQTRWIQDFRVSIYLQERPQWFRDSVIRWAQRERALNADGHSNG